MRCNAAQYIGRLRNVNLATDFSIRIDLLRIHERHLRQRILQGLWTFHNRLDRECPDLSTVLVEHCAQVLLRLVVLARSDNNRVFHRAHYYLRIDSLFPADRVYRVIKLACHDLPCRFAPLNLPALVSSPNFIQRET